MKNDDEIIIEFEPEQFCETSKEGHKTKSNDSDQVESSDEVLIDGEKCFDEDGVPDNESIRNTGEISECFEGEPCPECRRNASNNNPFCERCGLPLFRVCPECGADVSIFSKFCKDCGTDANGFKHLLNAGIHIQEFSKQKRWRNVVDEFEKLNLDIPMPGKKGNHVKKTLIRLHNNAFSMLEKLRQYRKELQSLIDGERFTEAMNISNEYLEIYPYDKNIKEYAKILKIKSAKADYASLIENIRDNLTNGNTDAADSACMDFLMQHPGTQQCEDVQKILDNEIVLFNTIKQIIELSEQKRLRTCRTELNKLGRSNIIIQFSNSMFAAEIDTVLDETDKLTIKLKAAEQKLAENRESCSKAFKNMNFERCFQLINNAKSISCEETWIADAMAQIITIKKKISDLLSQANTAFDNKKWKRLNELCNNILKIDPNCNRAVFLKKQIAKKKRRKQIICLVTSVIVLVSIAGAYFFAASYFKEMKNKFHSALNENKYEKAMDIAKQMSRWYSPARTFIRDFPNMQKCRNAADSIRARASNANAQSICPDIWQQALTTYNKGIKNLADEKFADAAANWSSASSQFQISFDEATKYNQIRNAYISAKQEYERKINQYRNLRSYGDVDWRQMEKFADQGAGSSNNPEKGKLAYLKALDFLPKAVEAAKVTKAADERKRAIAKMEDIIGIKTETITTGAKGVRGEKLRRFSDKTEITYIRKNSPASYAGMTVGSIICLSPSKYEEFLLQTYREKRETTKDFTVIPLRTRLDGTKSYGLPYLGRKFRGLSY